jgi:hypothetical protein
LMSCSNIRQHSGSTCNAGISIMSSCSSSCASAETRRPKKSTTKYAFLLQVHHWLQGVVQAQHRHQEARV